MNEERLAKLPKWAQQEMRALQRQRDTAVRKLMEFEEFQEPSKIWSEDLIQLGKGLTSVRHYFQAHDVAIEHAGVHLSVRGLYDNTTPMHLTWRPAGEGWAHGDVAFIPESYQQARLVAMERKKL